ncbi:MAG: Glycosyl phosphatidyl inositol protein transamidase complex subunit [Geoglossum simile]|nr:MAG: Glycosyl phosphatidyl inositol protein transamidase complex subunit [Geoglossum simile]
MYSQLHHSPCPFHSCGGPLAKFNELEAVPAVSTLRRDPRLINYSPHVSALCIVVGVVWLLLLPLDSYSRQTYISENALLPGQVHTYFGGSEQYIFRAYRREVEALNTNETNGVVSRLDEIFKSAGLKVARQKYNYTSSGKEYSGENVYSILHAPRGDATEAVVLVAAWRNMDGELNESGVALVLTLARYFKRWSLWSKDIIFLITADSRAGPQAWVDAYHDAHSPPSVSSLPLKGGVLQGVVVVDYPFSHPFEFIHIVYDGINGQLPNLDLFNTAVSIASGQMGIGTVLQQMWKHNDRYRDRLQTMLRGMVNQGLGHASGPHSSFIPYHVDAITLQAVGEGSHDEMALGRTVESLFRSLNNLLEHFHQSFFFYLLMQANRFVSIGTYLPSAMLIVVNFTITAMSLWVQSGRPNISTKPPTSPKGSSKKIVGGVKKDRVIGAIPTQGSSIIERKLFLPLVFVIGVHFLGVVPLYVFNHSSEKMITTTFISFAIFNFILPYICAIVLKRYFHPTRQEILLIKSFSLLLLGMFLSALATLNFSLAFLVGLSSVPLTFASPIPDRPALATIAVVLMSFLSPAMVLICSSVYWKIHVNNILIEAAFGWDVWGMWTQVVVWCVWWPAWLTGTVLVASSLAKPNSGRVSR